MNEDESAIQGHIMDWDIICLAEEGEKAKKIPMATLGKRLFARLETLWSQWGGEIHTVLIENQPSRLNGQMKSIQMMIYSYFIYKSPSIETLLVNASGKLKTHEEAMKAIPECPYEGYKKNKWTSIQLCDYYIRNDEELKNRIGTHKKKDDLCDALLQAMGWYHKIYKTTLTEIVRHSVPILDTTTFIGA